MVHFPQITLREWIQPFLRVMKLIECVQSEQGVCSGDGFHIHSAIASAAASLRPVNANECGLRRHHDCWETDREDADNRSRRRHFLAEERDVCLAIKTSLPVPSLSSAAFIFTVRTDETLFSYSLIQVRCVYLCLIYYLFICITWTLFICLLTVYWSVSEFMY